MILLKNSIKQISKFQPKVFLLDIRKPLAHKLPLHIRIQNQNIILIFKDIPNQFLCQLSKRSHIDSENFLPGRRGPQLELLKLCDLLLSGYLSIQKFDQALTFLVVADEETVGLSVFEELRQVKGQNDFPFQYLNLILFQNGLLLSFLTLLLFLWEDLKGDIRGTKLAGPECQAGSHFLLWRSLYIGFLIPLPYVNLCVLILLWLTFYHSFLFLFFYLWINFHLILHTLSFDQLLNLRSQFQLFLNMPQYLPIVINIKLTIFQLFQHSNDGLPFFNRFAIPTHMQFRSEP